ncbi:MAG TPA: RloB family protein [Bryobacteraceae bacterium]|nr:RloB family protein [Bryobacteraceae bacterium]
MPRVLIVCEGKCTEKGYFEFLRHDEKIPIDLCVEGGGTPKSLVERAVTLKREAKADAKKSDDPYQEFDEVWCVFDVDEHPYLPEAKQQARDNGVKVAISNPCFELWVLLHFRDQRAHIGRTKLQSECRKHLPGYEKNLPGDKLRDTCMDAAKRARELHAWHVSTGTTGANPSTDVYNHRRKNEVLPVHARLTITIGKAPSRRSIPTPVFDETAITPSRPARILDAINPKPGTENVPVAPVR